MYETPFQRARRQMEAFWDEAIKRYEEMAEADGMVPARVPLDIWETEDEVMVAADLPGVDVEHIEVYATRDDIEITADAEMERFEEDSTVVVHERGRRRFHRIAALPATVDPDSASAHYDDGVLTVTLQKHGDRDRTAVQVS